MRIDLSTPDAENVKKKHYNYVTFVTTVLRTISFILNISLVIFPQKYLYIYLPGFFVYREVVRKLLNHARTQRGLLSSYYPFMCSVATKLTKNDSANFG